MGNDPRTSVVDRYHRSHDVRNLFICDGGSMVSSSRGCLPESRSRSARSCSAFSRCSAFHSTFVALLVCEPHQRNFHVVAVSPGTTDVPRLTRDSKLVGLVRVLGKPIDFSSSPDLFDDELPAEDAAASRATRVDHGGTNRDGGSPSARSVARARHGGCVE